MREKINCPISDSSFVFSYNFEYATDCCHFVHTELCSFSFYLLLNSRLKFKEIIDMRRLTTAISSEKCVVRRFRRCANVIQCTYTNLDSTV